MMKLDLTHFPLMGDAITQKLFQIFGDEGVIARFVGGCVRDAILDIAAQDIDLAVPIPPDDIIFILTKANINVIPTGYDFGTITAVIEDRPFQVTSLREDWETDGRHTRVTYGKDWEQDAARRDFTINALYADADGTVYDYFGGLEDLKFGIIRFVGDAHQRIQEDFLRILRYFRFLAWYGHGPVNLEAMQACTAHNKGLKGLSRERIGHEFLKLLAAPMPLSSLLLMNKSGLTPFLLPQPLNLTALEALLNFEKVPKVMCRLAALSLPEIHIDETTKALRLSREQKQYLKYCHDRLESYPSSERTIYRNLYQDGVSLFQDLTMLSLTLRPLSSTPSILEAALKISASWKHPTFPIQGKDLVGMGVKPGPKLGDLLKLCEEWWIDQNFRPDRDDCLKWIRERQR
jgi:tRNA nucleotidyltransferase/poly(A) polymerase